MKCMSVKLRITIWITLLMVLMTAATLGIIAAVGGSLIDKSVKDRLSDVINRNADSLTYSEGHLTLQSSFEPYSDGVYTLVCLPNKKLLSGRVPEGFPLNKPFMDDEEPRVVRAGDDSFYIYDRLTDDGQVWLRGIFHISDAEDFTMMAARLSFIILPFLALLAVTGGYLIVKRAFRPIDRMIAAADAINEGRDLSARIGLPQSDDEIHRLAAAFDNMLGRLEDSFETEKQFASDASHELRTPTAVILAQCSVLSDESHTAHTAEEYAEGLAAIDRQAKKMWMLISRLLHLTRLEQGTEKVSLECADMSELTRVICCEFAASRPGIDLHYDVRPGVGAEIDVTLMTRLIENLLENAQKYGGGSIWVKLAEHDGSLTLTVRDNGEGMPPEVLARIWTRFYRADRARAGGGVGLGLALVKQIAALHNAGITAESSPRGGSIFTLTMQSSALPDDSRTDEDTDTPSTLRSGKMARQTL